MKRNVSVVRSKFRCNILISGKIIKEIPGSVASGHTILNIERHVHFAPPCIYYLLRYPVCQQLAHLCT